MADQAKKSLKSLKRYYALLNAAKEADMIPEEDRLAKRVAAEIQRQQVAIVRREDVETAQREENKLSKRVINEIQKQQGAIERRQVALQEKRLDDDKLSRRVVNELQKQREANEKRVGSPIDHATTTATTITAERKNKGDNKLSINVITEIQRQQEAISRRQDKKKSVQSPGRIANDRLDAKQLQTDATNDNKKLVDDRLTIETRKNQQLDAQNPQRLVTMAQQQEGKNNGLSDNATASEDENKGLSDKFTLQNDKQATNANERSPSPSPPTSPEVEPDEASTRAPSSPKDTKKSPKSPGGTTETRWSYKRTRTHKSTRTRTTKSTRSSKSTKSAKSTRSPYR